MIETDNGVTCPSCDEEVDEESLVTCLSCGGEPYCCEWCSPPCPGCLARSEETHVNASPGVSSTSVGVCNPEPNVVGLDPRSGIGPPVPLVHEPPPPPPEPLDRDFEVVALIEVDAAGVEVARDGEHRHEVAPAEGSFPQFVNLDADTDRFARRPEFGRVVRFKAQVRWTSANEKTLRGETVRFWFAAPQGVVNRADLETSEQAKFEGALGGRGATEPHLVEVETDDGWTGPVALRLSCYGGDAFAVRAAGPAQEGGSTSSAYVVWRKLWYQQVVMKDRHGGDTFRLSAQVWEGVHSALDRVFICLREDTSYLRRDVPFESLTPIVEGERTFLEHFSSSSRGPFTCLVVCANNCTNDMLCEVSVTYEAVEGPAWSWSDAAAELRRTGDATLRDLLSDYEGGAALDAHLEGPGRERALALRVSYLSYIGRWMPVPDEWIGRLDWTQAAPLALEVPEEDWAYASSNGRLDLRLDLFLAKLHFIGLGGGGRRVFLNVGHLNTLLTESVAEDERLAFQVGTLVHELGHALGLVDMPKKPAKSYPGGWGWGDGADHCRLETCVMYMATADDQAVYFLGAAGEPSCHDHLRRQAFTRSLMVEHWGA